MRPGLLIALALVSLACNDERKAPERRAGFANCDSSSENGDETDTQTDSRHCGRCNRVCSAKNATTSCVKGECQVTCNPGFAACGRPEDGCTAQLSTSVDHCGKCGNPCLTGHCGAGKCVESEILASDLFSYGVVSHDERFVYLNKAGSEQSFWRFPLAGGKPERVPEKPGDKALFVPWLYDGKEYLGCLEAKEPAPLGKERWGTCELVRGPLGGPAKLVRKLERFALGALALAGDELYYATMVADPESDQGAIYRVPIAGGQPKLVVETPEPLSIAVDGNHVFFASAGTRKAENADGGLFVVEKGQSNPRLLYRGRARSVTIDGKYVYFNGADVVMRLPKQGGEPERIAAPPPRWKGGIYGLTVTPTHVYYAIRGKDVSFRTLARVPKPR